MSEMFVQSYQNVNIFQHNNLTVTFVATSTTCIQRGRDARTACQFVMMPIAGFDRKIAYEAAIVLMFTGKVLRLDRRLGHLAA